jgi:nitrile hydratase beta subunit
MDGIHDLGGMAGFGPIEAEPNEPVFHEPWEGRAFGLNVLAIAVLDAYNADEYRHAIERMPPRHYLQASYYERVLTGASTLLVEKGVVQRDDLEARAGGTFPLSLPAVANPERSGSGTDAARFAIGDRVAVRDIHPTGHTRVPRYCRAKQGTVIHIAPPFTFPDDSAHGGRLRPERTYHVEFRARELWGEEAAENESIVIDLWETYLEPAA